MPSGASPSSESWASILGIRTTNSASPLHGKPSGSSERSWLQGLLQCLSGGSVGRRKSRWCQRSERGVGVGHMTSGVPINTTPMRTISAMAVISVMPDQPWLFWHMWSWRSRHAWVLLDEGSPWGTKVLRQAGKRWASRTDLDTRCALRRAIRIHSQRFVEQTCELCSRVGLARGMRRRRIGRPPGRWEAALAAAPGQDWADRVRDPKAVVDNWPRGQSLDDAVEPPPQSVPVFSWCYFYIELLTWASGFLPVAASLARHPLVPCGGLVLMRAISPSGRSGAKLQTRYAPCWRTCVCFAIRHCILVVRCVRMPAYTFAPHPPQ